MESSPKPAVSGSGVLVTLSIREVSESKAFYKRDQRGVSIDSVILTSGQLVYILE